jgi:hypothetical protein
MTNHLLNNDLAELLQALTDIEAHGAATYHYKAVQPDGATKLCVRTYQARYGATLTAHDIEVFSAVYNLSFHGGVIRGTEATTKAEIPYGDLLRALELPETKEACDRIVEGFKKCDLKINSLELIIAPNGDYTVIEDTTTIIERVQSHVIVDGETVAGDLSVAWAPSMPLEAGYESCVFADLQLSDKFMQLLKGAI